MPRVVISALGGGSGKTTVSLGLTAAVRKRGGRVVPFKKGPDYIDAGWLAAASGGSCYNLDPYLMDVADIRTSFARHAEGADLAVVEGNRGLYDGVDARGTFSTAELAKQIDAPVLLLLDTTKMTRTAAAIVLGCQKLDPALRLAGVILNRVGRKRQEQVIRKAIEDTCSIPVVGAIPRLKKNVFPERHMGLTPTQEHRETMAAIAAVAEVVEKHVDVGRICELAATAPNLPAVAASEEVLPPDDPVRIGVIRDSAFQFYYPENVTELEARGARIVPVRSLSDPELPALDALYIGGGFPETHAVLLAENEAFRRSLRDAAQDGLPIYAECGGLMYLGNSLRAAGRTWPMSGVLPVEFELHDRPRGHGYTNLVVDGENPFFEPGLKLRGHEFHYSSIRAWTDTPLPTAFNMTRGTGIGGARDGIVLGNVLAAYTHLHALGSPQWAEALVQTARRRKAERRTKDPSLS